MNLLEKEVRGKKQADTLRFFPVSIKIRSALQKKKEKEKIYSINPPEQHFTSDNLRMASV